MSNPTRKAAPERGHVLQVTAGGDTLGDLVHELRHLAAQLERGHLTVGVTGSPASGSVYSYRVDPEQTSERYFRQVEDWLASTEGAKP